MRVPDPAIVVLVGPSGAGKSTWAQQRYRPAEIVASDDLRAIVGSGRTDLDASADAFILLEQILAARARRGLTCVVDTLGHDRTARLRYQQVARSAGLPAVAVVFEVASALARARNAAREVPVPAPVLAAQLSRAGEVAEQVASEGWDQVVVVAADGVTETGPPPEQVAAADPRLANTPGMSLSFVLQLSRFGWGEDPAGWLASIARAAVEAGFCGIALMDHLIQIPQVGRAWEPIPEPWVTLGLLAGLDTDLTLGTLVSPVTYRPAGVTAKTVATLDALSGGRAFLGIGAGWWEREHAAFGVPFPAAQQRLDMLETSIETIRALWSPGTKAYRGTHVELPETTCYPRPVSAIPIIVGGAGARTLSIASRLGDGCNVSSDVASIERARAALKTHCVGVGRDPDEVALSVLDRPITGRDREQVWSRVERHRGRQSAAAFARARHAGTYVEQRQRYAQLAAAGVSTVFLALDGLAGPEDVMAAAEMLS